MYFKIYGEFFPSLIEIIPIYYKQLCARSRHLEKCFYNVWFWPILNQLQKRKAKNSVLLVSIDVDFKAKFHFHKCMHWIWCRNCDKRQSRNAVKCAKYVCVMLLWLCRRSSCSRAQPSGGNKVLHLKKKEKEEDT